MSNRVDVSNAKNYLQTNGKRLGKEFQQELIERAKKVALQVQQDLNKSVDKGAVSFTQRAVLFMYKKSLTGVTATIMIKDVQAKYLYDVIVDPKSVGKIVPTSAARLTKQGNIAGLRSNLASGRYVVVKGKNGKERLIDRNVKGKGKESKRVIGLFETKKRKIIYDFYAEVNKDVMLMISGIQGTFKVTRG